MFALDTLITHLKDIGREVGYYDSIITKDLGAICKDLLIELAKIKGINIEEKYNDCGVMIFNKNEQDTHSGKIGCVFYLQLYISLIKY